MPKSKGTRTSNFEHIALQKNRFAALELDSSSDSEEELSSSESVASAVEDKSLEETSKGQMRKWSNPDSESHVNIFNSPFYKGKRPAFKQNTRPRFVDEEWTSIAEESGAKVTYEDRAPIAREEAKTPTGNTIIFPPEEDTTTAAMWAEKVKECLEKAEAARAKPDDFHESLNRLSFFRRPMAK
jgi:hypothetical protein